MQWRVKSKWESIPNFKRIPSKLSKESKKLWFIPSTLLFCAMLYILRVGLVSMFIYMRKVTVLSSHSFVMFHRSRFVAESLSITDCHINGHFPAVFVVPKRDIFVETFCSGHFVAANLIILTRCGDISHLCLWQQNGAL